MGDVLRPQRRGDASRYEEQEDRSEDQGVAITPEPAKRKATGAEAGGTPSRGRSVYADYVELDLRCDCIFRHRVELALSAQVGGGGGRNVHRSFLPPPDSYSPSLRAQLE